MARYTPEAAKAFLLEQLRLQSALDQLPLSERELGFLADNTEFEDELTMPQHFTTISADQEFLDRVTVLLHNSEKRLQKSGEAAKLTEAMQMVCQRDDYFSGILWERFDDVVYNPALIPPQGPRTWKDNLITLGVALTLCGGVIGGIIYWLDHGEQWRARYARFLARHPALAGLHLPYIAWLQNPTGWFQQNAGKYLIMAIVTIGVVFWAQKLWNSLTKKTGA